MKRRSFTLGIGSVAIAILGVIGSSALSRVTTGRATTVQQTGDGTAYLGLAPSDDPNGEYATTNETTGAFRLFIDTVNPEGVTELDDVFVITNNGTQPVDVWLEPDGENPESIAFTDAETETDLTDADEPVTISVGESITTDIFVDTTDHGEETEIIDTLIVNANIGSMSTE
ncbi:hypothetical protein EA462_10530 [Natrarchaeobius halalkaliphilus]|uniref:DUF1102 domain-containing protein n=1 Tax=Natrarchaeobius halalkaliphilus TaxID=1679091 RepID=A0A3N6NWC5_9EURY|nr:hypothetical protein [Natrarchaeobius halalkaliphilus]RQG88829.1 hypothetical protein EA462_10530 [Natrarchaeobius halalkaliphilus]